MSTRELVFTKQSLLITKDWDTYQAILRKCLRTVPKRQKQESGRK